ncbi:hypothetical protein HLB23_06335 [Nocardia uniformis]|uniref:Uncharacterized protein n=1 Tax=Nocardia uniformis TaxID=53432 RepID=A0A849C3E4_9NOCA|nr:hypothetical protein [Nocardia uniformis]NNH69489.1 hypothetical protein [Nocardia uniformis]
MAIGAVVEIAAVAASASVYGKGASAAIGGAAGFIGSAAQGGSSWTDHLTAAGTGAVAGFIGAGAGAVASKIIGKGHGAFQLKRAEGALGKARRSFSELNSRGSIGADIEKAKSLADDAAVAYAKAGKKKLKAAAQKKMDAADKEHGVLAEKSGLPHAEYRVHKAERALDQLKGKSSSIFDNHSGKWKDWLGRPAGAGSRVVQGVGAGGLYGLQPRLWGPSGGDSSDGSDGSDGGDGAVSAVSGTWVGGHVASMSEGPFQPGDPTGRLGTGFLWQPDGLADDLQRWYGGSVVVSTTESGGGQVGD